MFLDLVLRRVTGKDKVTIFVLRVAAKASLELRLVGQGFAVLEVTKSPAAGCGVFFGVINHELNVRGISDHERLLPPKDLVVFLR